jgi:transcriptional regulator with XRE-family HTH domain
MEDWIKRAKKLMKQKNLTQKDVASSMGKTTGGAVGHYFTGRSKPTLDQVKGLAKKLGVSFSKLVEGHDTVDEEILEICLQLIEEAETESNLNLSEKQKAKMVTYLYRLSKEGEIVTSKNALELIKLYA